MHTSITNFQFFLLNYTFNSTKIQEKATRSTRKTVQTKEGPVKTKTPFQLRLPHKMEMKKWPIFNSSSTQKKAKIWEQNLKTHFSQHNPKCKNWSISKTQKRKWGRAIKKTRNPCKENERKGSGEHTNLDKKWLHWATGESREGRASLPQPNPLRGSHSRATEKKPTLKHRRESCSLKPYVAPSGWPCFVCTYTSTLTPSPQIYTHRHTETIIY